MKKAVKIFMRQGTIVLLIAVVLGCGAVPSLKEGSVGVLVRLPFVRVLLDSSNDELKINSTTAFSLECIRGDKSYVYHGSHPLKINANNGVLSVSMNNSLIGNNFTELLITPRGKNGLLSHKGTMYRGVFRVLPRGKNVQLVNVIHMDDYLKGVVPPEIGFSNEAELEAIKAQAVAARTYSMSHLEQYDGENYDMKADVSDQVYLGVDVEKKNVNKAIDETRGVVMKYQGDLINAYYHSTCGGYTDDIDEVWDKRDMPYLRAVNDSGYCDWSKYYTWEESYTHDQLKLLLEQYLSTERGRRIKIKRIEDIYIQATTAGGRVRELVIKTDERSYTFGKDRIRWIFKRASNPELILQSARFKVDLERDGRGRIKRINLKGGGYGHGVGMCQCGAIGMARKGWVYQDILTFYYRNIELVKLY